MAETGQLARLWLPRKLALVLAVVAASRSLKSVRRSDYRSCALSQATRVSSRSSAYGALVLYPVAAISVAVVSLQDLIRDAGSASSTFALLAGGILVGVSWLLVAAAFSWPVHAHSASALSDSLGGTLSTEQLAKLSRMLDEFNGNHDTDSLARLRDGDDSAGSALKRNPSVSQFCLRFS